MEYLGAGWPVVNSLNVGKGITDLALNINLNCYNCWQNVMRQKYIEQKDKAVDNVSCVK